MPIYVYRCSECEHEFDRLQKLSDEPEKICPECNKEVKRIITKSNFVLKGENWFKNSGGY